VIGPAFAADEVADAVEAVIDTYRRERSAGERFIDTVRRLGVTPFRASADQARLTTTA
jgi:sulfite reductase (NADPH) hemoprotein beta-component